MDVAIQLVAKDATRVEADVLALKYAQANYGLDAVVSQLLIDGGRQPSLIRPKSGGFRVVDGVAGIAAEKVLFLGVASLYEFRYVEIREFSYRTLAALASQVPASRSVVLTLHGANYGLDEYEAFEAEIAGLIDAIKSKDCPGGLTDIIIAELNRGRAERLQSVLGELIPSGRISGPSNQQSPRKLQRTERLRSAGYSSASKAHVFVAIPFKEEMDDVYHYGIQSAVRKAGFLCERADLSTFAGDVVEWVRARIRSSQVVVGDLTEANPNVYLEVGYAWGCDIPTVLIVRDTNELKFDVRGQRCLAYKKIKDLEGVLTKELKSLKKSGGI